MLGGGTPLPNPTPEPLYLVGNNRFYKGFQSEKVVFYSVSNYPNFKISYVGGGGHPLPNSTPVPLYVVVDNNCFYKGFQSEKVVFSSVSNNPNFKIFLRWEGDTPSKPYPRTALFGGQ